MVYLADLEMLGNGFDGSESSPSDVEEKQNKQGDADSIHPAQAPSQRRGLRGEGVGAEAAGAHGEGAGPPAGVIRHWSVAKSGTPMLGDGIDRQRHAEAQHRYTIDHGAEVPLVTGE